MTFIVNPDTIYAVNPDFGGGIGPNTDKVLTDADLAAFFADSNFVSLKAAADAAASSVGPGSKLVTIVCEIDGQPIDGVAVRLSTDSAGENIIAGPLYSNAAGEVRFYVESPLTYYVWRQRAPANFTNPMTIIWNEDTSQYELES